MDSSSSSSSASPSPHRDEDHTISSHPPALPASVRLLNARPPANSADAAGGALLTALPDSYDASSDDEAVPPPSALIRPSRKGAKGAKGRGVKPHSGLEAQDAADYERRLDQMEARDALVGVTRSGGEGVVGCVWAAWLSRHMRAHTIRVLLS